MSDFGRNVTIGRVGALVSVAGDPVISLSMFTMPRGVLDHPFINTGLFLRPAEATELADALRDAVAHVTPVGAGSASGDE